MVVGMGLGVELVEGVVVEIVGVVEGAVLCPLPGEGEGGHSFLLRLMGTGRVSGTLLWGMMVGWGRPGG